MFMIYELGFTLQTERRFKGQIGTENLNLTVGPAVGNMVPTSMVTRVGLMVLLLILQVFSTEASLSRLPNIGKVSPASSDSHSEVFIVYLGGVTQATHSDAHIRMLSDVLGSAGAAHASIVYSYTNSFNGFAAVISDSEADLLRGMDEVVSVFLSKTHQLQTTYSWEFLGLNQNQGLWPSANFGNDTIIGMIDTGVWPESQSFSDEGFGPIPSTWKGECVKSDHFGPENCNKKLIGGKFFSKGYEAAAGPIVAPEYNSPRDDLGHGTHTTSTAGGRQVSNASFDGVCNGTISGGAPNARLAAYRACWAFGCFDSDLLAAFDAAVEDGVNLISISIGGFTINYFDGIAIGAYHAVEHGILVAAAAGNFGPTTGFVSNGAPWIFTVAASTMNRQFTSVLELGCNSNTLGTTTSALNTFTLNESSYPLAYGPDIAISASFIGDASFCRDGSIDKLQAKGKILLCQDDDFLNTTDDNVLPSGAAGVIVISTAANDIVQFLTVMPAINVDQSQASVILNCIADSQSNDTSPTAIFRKSETVFQSGLPLVAPASPFFSSPGPNIATQDILKPDIAAPGVDIIASWSPVANPSERPGDPRHTNFNIISGTSMATPHVAGAAALIKSVHPDWSPAAVKSALMTTATIFADPINQFNVSRELASGSGQINPTKAVDPGLIYDLKTSDYENFLCGIGYTAKQVQMISGNKTDSCPPVAPQAFDLNYPSIMLVGPILRVGSFSATTKRILTNVGPASGNATYTVSVVNPNGVNVTVTPTTLTFADINAEESFNVGIIVDSTVEDFVFGSITWSDTNGHSVRIPIGFGYPY